MGTYKIVGKQKVGNKLVWCLEDLHEINHTFTVGSKELKELLVTEQITNAVWKGEVKEVPDVFDSILALHRGIMGNFINVVETKSVFERADLPTTKYLKVYTQDNKDVTGLFYNALCRECKLSKNNELIVKCDSNTYHPGRRVDMLAKQYRISVHLFKDAHYYVLSNPALSIIVRKEGVEPLYKADISYLTLKGI